MYIEQPVFQPKIYFWSFTASNFLDQNLKSVEFPKGILTCKCIKSKIRPTLLEGEGGGRPVKLYRGRGIQATGLHYAPHSPHLSGPGLEPWLSSH